MNAYGLSRTIFNFLTAPRERSLTFTDEFWFPHRQLKNTSRTPLGRSHTIFWIPHGRLTGDHGLSRSTNNFLTETSRTLIDYTDDVRFPHGHLTTTYGISRTNFWLSYGHPTNYQRILQTNFNFPMVTLRTLTDFHGQIFDSPTDTSWTLKGLLRTIFNFFMGTSRKLLDLREWISISSRAHQRRSRTLRTNFDFTTDTSQPFTDFQRGIFDFPTDSSRTIKDFRGQILISLRTLNGRSQTFTDEFWFPHGHLTTVHRL